MKYAALVYLNEQELDQLTQSQWDEMNQECMSCGEKLDNQGYTIGAEALQSVKTATTLRKRNNKLQLTDGPFAETKEQLAGFYLLDVKDLNEAIQVASQIPGVRYGSVEVRPIRELSNMNNPRYDN